MSYMLSLLHRGDVCDVIAEVINLQHSRPSNDRVVRDVHSIACHDDVNLAPNIARQYDRAVIYGNELLCQALEETGVKSGVALHR